MQMIQSPFLKGVGQSMAKPGRDTEYPFNLFTTWLDYRESLGEKRSDIIRATNKKLRRKYDNNSFYKWGMQVMTVPEIVLQHMVVPDLPKVLEYFFTTYGIPTKGIDFDMLALGVKPAIMETPLKEVIRLTIERENKQKEKRESKNANVDI